MGFDSTIIAAVIGVVGTGFAALLATVGYLYKTRQEARKSVRKVLYYLLEIRSALSSFRLDPNFAADQLIVRAKQRLSKKWKLNLEEFPVEMREILSKHFSNLFIAMRPEIDSHLIELFHGSLLDLAQTHPILAFKLRGKEKLKDGFAVTEEYTETVAKKFAAEFSDERLSNSMLTMGGNFKGKALDDVIKILNDDILRVAWASGAWHFIRCKRLINKSRGMIELDFSGLDDAVDELVNHLIKHAPLANAAARTTTPTPERNVA